MSAFDVPAPPASIEDVRAQLHVAGLTIKQCLAWLEGNEPYSRDPQIEMAHGLLNRAGYKLEDATGVPDGYYGAGGTSKSGGGGSGGGGGGNG